MKKNATTSSWGGSNNGLLGVPTMRDSSSFMANDPYAMKRSGSNLSSGSATFNPSIFGSIFQKVDSALDSTPQETEQFAQTKQGSKFGNNTNQSSVVTVNSNVVKELTKKENIKSSTASSFQRNIVELEELSDSDEDSVDDRIKTLEEFEDFSPSDEEDSSPNVIVVTKSSNVQQSEPKITSATPLSSAQSRPTLEQAKHELKQAKFYREPEKSAIHTELENIDFSDEDFSEEGLFHDSVHEEIEDDNDEVVDEEEVAYTNNDNTTESFEQDHSFSDYVSGNKEESFEEDFEDFNGCGDRSDSSL